MTTGELFTSHSTAPDGSTALYNLETLCQEGGCGEFGLIPITDIKCDLVIAQLGCDLVVDTLSANLQTTTLDAILTTNILSGDLIIPILDGELLCQ